MNIGMALVPFWSPLKRFTLPPVTQGVTVQGQDVIDVDYLEYEEKVMIMHNPQHPGEVLRELCIKPLGVTVTDAAKALGVSRKTLSELLNGHGSITPEMAIRLSIAFDTTPESWLTQQMQYDLWQAEQKRKELKVERLLAA
jgi:addiction module HigA family antidote